MIWLNIYTLFLSKKLALFVLTMLIYIIFLAAVFVFLVHPARYNIWLLFIPQSLLCLLPKTLIFNIQCKLL